MTHLLSRISWCVGACALFSVPLGSANVFAAEANSASSIADNSYSASFFTQYQPQNALEMIKRVPGFSFDRGDDARGFGGNAGNVLINGARPTSKSGGLAGALQRIPAAQVDRIEIIRGGISAGEAGGQTVVANVIKLENVTSGTWVLKFRQSEFGSIRPNVEGAIVTTIGQWNGAFDIDLGQGPSGRTAQLSSFDANDKLTELAHENFASLGRFAFSNAQLDRTFDSGKLTLNGRVGTDTWTGDFIRDIQKLGEFDSQWELKERSNFKTVEVGVDWVEKLEQWKWHSLGIVKIEKRGYRNVQTDYTLKQQTSQGMFEQDKLEKEFIVRNTYGYAGSDAFKPEFGIEIANNTLDVTLDYVDDGVVQQLDNANVTVEELRGEVFASFVYNASDKTTLEGGLTAEFSKIDVDGDTPKSQSFDFLKPRVAANYKVNDDLSLNLELQHVVGQLDFNDFAASSEAEEDRDISGNSDLVPEQISQITGTLDWSFSEKGSVKFDVYHHWHKDILEEIELHADGKRTGVAVGNAGDSTMWGFNTNINLPIDAVLDNGLIEINYSYRDTKFRDEIIGRYRKTSDYIPRNLKVKFRQDLPEYHVSWGGEYKNHFTETSYLVDEVYRFSGNDRVDLYVETTYFAGLKVQLEVIHANTGRYELHRTQYDTNRNGNYDGQQISERERKPKYKLSIWGTF